MTIKFKLLYIEHEPDRTHYIDAMERAGAQVTLLGYPETEKLEKCIMNNRFDLVVTDACFLPDGKDHEYGYEECNEESNLLEKIIKTIRDIDDSSRLKIAVHTRFPNSLVDSDDFLKILSSIDYIWEKASLNNIYLQIKILIQKVAQNKPDHILVESLMSLIKEKQKEGINLPNDAILLEVLDVYSKKQGEREQIESISDTFNKLCNQATRNNFIRLLKNIKDAEILNVASSPEAWGHMRHVLNVFWLGYYILNLRFFDLEKTHDLTFAKKINSDLNEKIINVNQIWLLASIFHDIGLLGERTTKLMEKCNQLLSIYNKVEIGTIAKLDFNKIQENVDKALIQINRGFGETITPFVVECNKAEMVNENIDHGILSAITVYDNFKAEKDLALIAASAVSLHNIYTKYFDKAITQKLDFSEHPLAALLILCDLLEVWDRQTGLENSFSHLPLKSSELKDISVDEQLNKIELTINYKPYEYILPSDHQMRVIKQKIDDILQEKVIPPIDGLNLPDLFGFSMHIRFILDGRKLITEASYS